MTGDFRASFPGSAWVVVALGLPFISGCLSMFVMDEPTLDEPHATIEFRIVHHSALGPEWSNGIARDQRAVKLGRECHGATVGASCSQTIRARPEPAVWRFSTDYYHSETRTRTVPVTRTESYACGTYTTGTGSYQTTQTQMCTRSVTEYRTETYTVRIPHGACRTELPQTPRVGASYLIYYEFYVDERCTARCFRRHGTPGESQRMVPCGDQEETLPLRRILDQSTDSDEAE